MFLAFVAWLLAVPPTFAAAAASPPGDSHLIFVTSVAYDGALGGLAGADERCSSLAASGSVSGPYGRTWRALLSVNGVIDARVRIRWEAPVYDVSGLLVTNHPESWPWVQDGTSTVLVDEWGQSASNLYVWTGSSVSGVSKGSSLDCGGWTNGTDSANGWAGESGHFGTTSWIDSFGNACDQTWFSLYCISYVEGTVFVDDFETGNTGVWSSRVP